MNTLKHFLLKLLIIGVIFFLFVGCSKRIIGIEDTKKIKIGVCISSFNDKYGSYMVEEMKDYSKSLNDVEVIIVDAKHDTNTQLSQVEDFISQKVNVIIVNPVYTDSSNSIADKVKATNIPIISLMNPFQNQDDAACHIAPDSKQAATLEMECLAKKMNYKGNVAIIMGPIEDRAQKARTEACHEVIAKYPDMKVVAQQTAEWNRARGKAVMEKWIQSNKQIDGVVSNNDEMAIGAIDAIEEAGKHGKIIVASIDGTPDALDYLKSGKLAVDVFQDAGKLAQCSIDTAVKAAKGEKIEKEIDVKTELVTQGEADKYIAKWKNGEKK